MSWAFTGETKTYHGVTLKRIRATADTELKGGIVIHAGELGGWIEDESNLAENAWVGGDAMVYGDATARNHALVCGSAIVSGDAVVDGRATVCDDSRVYGSAIVCGYAVVGGNAIVCGYALVCGRADVLGDAVVRSSEDYAVFKNTWSSFRWFTYTRSNKQWAVGCFYGTGDELVKKAYKDSDKSGKCYAAIVKATETIEAAKAS